MQSNIPQPKVSIQAETPALHHNSRKQQHNSRTQSQSSGRQSVGNRALGHGSIVRNRRVLVDLGLVMLEGSVCDGAHLAGLLLSEVRVGGRQVCADGADDGAGRVGDGALLVGVLEGRAGAGVLDLRRGYVGVVVDDRVSVMLDFGVCDGAAGFGVVDVVVRVVGRQRGRGGADDGADLLGGGHG